MNPTIDYTNVCLQQFEPFNYFLAPEETIIEKVGGVTVYIHLSRKTLLY